MQGLGGLGLGGASKVPKMVADGNTVMYELMRDSVIIDSIELKNSKLA